MKVRAFLCSENALIDKRTNLISLINIIESLGGVGLPFGVPRLVISSIFEKEKGDSDKFQFSIIIKINDDVLHKQDVKADFKGKNINRSFLELVGVSIPSLGDLILELKLQKESRQYIIKVENIQTKIQTQKSSS
ncbi:hypothetical protein ACFL5L_04085 [candidate division KSB1 bacterium]